MSALTPEEREALSNAIDAFLHDADNADLHIGGPDEYRKYAATLTDLRDRLDAAEPWGYVADTEWLPGDAWGMTVVKQPTNYRSVPVFLAPPAPAAPRVPDGWQLAPLEPTREMIEAGAQRLVSWEDGCVWPDSWDAVQVAAARNEAERVWRSMWLAASPRNEQGGE